MSLGGDFYALSDDQLQRLLDEKLYYGEFLAALLEEKPRECFSDGEYYWFELTRLLAPEDACGVDHTDVIPEMSGYSFAEQVLSTAQALARLSEEKLRQRHSQQGIEQDFGELYSVIQGVIAFYQRAAQQGDAVLFRVT